MYHPFTDKGKHPEHSCWSYENNGAVHWPTLSCIKHNSCGKSHQSPIDIVSSNAKKGGADLTGLVFGSYNVPITNFTLSNSGTALELEITEARKRTLSGGGLPGTYLFLGMHFHLDATSTSGSEHRLEGKSFPMEIHMVHYNDKYTPEEATTEKDGITVLAILNRVATTENSAMDVLVSRLDTVTRGHPHALTVGKVLTLQDFFPVDTTRFFKYSGSFTTPPCTEVVTWIVLADPADVKEAHLEAIRNKGFKGNVRPLQKLNGREIFKSF